MSMNHVLADEAPPRAAIPARFTQTDSQALYAARGLGIVLVAVGHIVEGPLKAYIYLFHMPLFFLLSGIAARQFGTINAKTTSKRLRTLLVPTAIAGAILFGLYFIDRSAYGAPGLPGALSAFWFTAALALIFVLLQLVGEHARRMWPLAAAAVIGCVLAMHIAPIDRVPRVLLGAVFGLQFFLLGYFVPWRFYVERRLLILGLAALAASSLAFLGLSMDMAAKNFGLPLVGAAYAALFSAAVIAVFLYVPTTARSIVGKIGQASLFILLYHQAVHLLMRHFVPRAPTMDVLVIAVAAPTATFYLLRGRGRVAGWIGAR